MAAVLCKSIGELCALPCKCCAVGCRGCGEVCNGACRGCDQFCGLLCHNPFSMFVAVALFTQGPAIFLVIPALGGIPDCVETTWLIINSVLAAVNVGTAFYLAYRIVDTSNAEMEHLDTAFKRASYLLCHDCWMAIYICLAIGFLCVQAWGTTLGFQSLFESGIPEDDQTCPEAAGSMVKTANGLGWAFCFLGFAALVFSMCCAKFDSADYSRPTNETGANNTNPSVPHGSYDANPQHNTQYSAQGVPNNDFPQADIKKNGKATSSAPPPMYTQQGVPTNDFVAPNAPPSKPQYKQQQQQQDDIPVAYAEEIPPSSQASAPPSEYDTPSAGAHAGTNNNNSTVQQDAQNNTAGGKVGGNAGKQIGKLFTNDQAKQEKIAQQGQKAGEAAEAGFLAAKNFIQSKMKGKDDKK